MRSTICLLILSFASVWFVTLTAAGKSTCTKTCGSCAKTYSGNSDWQFLANNCPCEPTPPSDCKCGHYGSLDLTFLLENSWYSGEENFMRGGEMLIDVLKCFSGMASSFLNKDKVRIGLITYNKASNVEISLGDGLTLNDFLEIEKIVNGLEWNPPESKVVQVNKAIKELFKEVEEHSTSDTPKASVLIGSGKMGGQSKLDKRVEQLADLDINMFSMGTAIDEDGYDTEVLKALSGEEHTFMYDEYTKDKMLQQLMTMVHSLCCDISGPCHPNPCKNDGTCALDYEEDEGFKCTCPAAWIGETCENKHPCAVNPCKNGGQCIPDETELGEYDCHCTGNWMGKNCDVASGLCRCVGDPHCLTYDQVWIHYQGICKYLVAYSDVEEGAYRVIGKNQNYSNPNAPSRVSSTKYLETHVKGHVIVIGQWKVVTVDGTEVFPPVEVTKGVYIEADGRFVQVRTSFLIVSFDGRWDAHFRVSNDYKNKVKGLCGNFNGDGADDWLTKDGTNVASRSDRESVLGDSFQVTDTTDPVCKTKDEKPPECTADQFKRVQSKEFCGMFQDTSGPFANCISDSKSGNEDLYKNCKFDVCAAMDDTDAAKADACGLLREFDQDCTDLGHTQDWLEEANCGNPCDAEPCQNGGVCTEEDNDDGYMCRCNRRYLGKNCETDKRQTARDCVDVLNKGNTESGVYQINVAALDDIEADLVDVLCDQETDGGGWIVLMQRKDGSVDFDRLWADYRNGFGDNEGEFWIGLEIMNKLTNKHGMDYEFRSDFRSYLNKDYYNAYSFFQVEDEDANYKLHVGQYLGGDGDSFHRHHLMMFSTRDKDNDRYTRNCAELAHGGFWFHACSSFRPTGKYGEKIPISQNFYQGIITMPPFNAVTHAKEIDMKIRRI